MNDCDGTGSIKVNSSHSPDDNLKQEKNFTTHDIKAQGAQTVRENGGHESGCEFTGHCEGGGECETAGVKGSCERDGLKQGCVTDGLKQGCVTDGLKQGCVTDGLKQGCERDGLKQGCERDGLKQGCERDGVKGGCETDRTKGQCKTGGVKALCERDGIQDGVKSGCERGGCEIDGVDVNCTRGDMKGVEVKGEGTTKAIDPCAIDVKVEGEEGGGAGAEGVGKVGSDSFPLHWLVWHNNYRRLEKELTEGKHNKEVRDPRGRTPLMLAVTLGHLESSRVLLRHHCNVNVETVDGWTVVQEATGTGDPELLGVVLEGRDTQRYSSRVAGIPALLAKLKEAPDFYVEMKWEFTSWVPLVSRMCPSDTYRVYKSGSNVRIDTTLIGFDQTSWQRGNRSYIFKGLVDGATMMEVDHETGQVFVEKIRTLPPDQAQAYLRPNPGMVSHRLTTPIGITYIDTEKISFERDKAGIWGWRSDRSENVNGHDCKVFSAMNVELVTKTRTEHLTDADKEKLAPRSPIQSFLNIAEVEEKNNALTNEDQNASSSMNNPSNITAEEYFDPEVDLVGRDIGRPKEITKKVQSFKAHLWLAEEYPLKLQEQVMPIVDLMAISSSHFAKLKHFIQMQLPNGFPVKIEIPLFHVLTARVTFGNIFGVDEAKEKVTTLSEEDRLTCVIDESVFDPPASYTVVGHSDQQHVQLSLDEDDALLHYAIQQSLVEAGTEQDQVDIWEALQADHRPTPRQLGSNSKPGSRPNTPAHLGLQSMEDTQLQRAIEESLALNLRDQRAPDSAPPQPTPQTREVEDDVAVPGNMDVTPGGGSALDSELAIALSLSQQAQEEEDAQRRQEEETLKRILELSLTEK